PQRPVLFCERNEAAVRTCTRRAPRIGQQHQRQQAGHLTIGGQQPPHLAGEADRLGGQLAALQVRAGARRVALVEDQVEHVQDDPQPGGALWLRREAERDAAGLDGLLGAADALSDRRLRDEEGSRDLRRRQAADRAQGERELRRRGEGWVRGQEQQGQRAVLPGRQALVARGRRAALLARPPPPPPLPPPP